MLQTIKPRWTECIVAATGPSLNEEVADKCKGYPVVVVNDAYRLIPFAEILYACDARWWEVHHGTDFKGEKWSSHDNKNNDKLKTAEKYGLNIVQGKDAEGFSTDPSVIHYGSNSGFQAINLAMHFGAQRIMLVGFDMRVNGKRHFFGDHPKPLSNGSRFESFIPAFERAAKGLDIEIINLTPDSALQCFPMADINDYLPRSSRG